MAVPKVAAINDLSGLGKCSLTGGNTNFIGMRSAGGSNAYRSFEQSNRF